jgi:uncharacterized protein involved in exopolysaccharide biosynthesis
MSMYQEEINLKPYLLNIIRNWWQIGAVVILTASVTLVFNFMQPRKYEAVASILVTRSRAVLELADQFPTLNEQVDWRSRMDAFISISRSDKVASDTFNTTRDSLSEIVDLQEFKSRVKINNIGDLIQVIAVTKDPVLSAEIANKWAEESVLTINQAYSGDQLPSEIHDQVITAQEEYRNAQADLENFIAENNIELLNQQINEAQSLSEALINQRLEDINYYSQRKLEMEQVIRQAEALKEQMDNGNGSNAAALGDYLAVLKARTNTFRIEPTNPNLDGNPTTESNRSDLVINLQLPELNSPEASLGNFSQDIDSLINQAKLEVQQSDEQLNANIQKVLQGDEYNLIQESTEKIQDLQKSLEKLQAREKELTSERDLAWNTYQALVQKETEIRNTSKTNDHVSLATKAVPPQNPTSRGIIQKTAIGGLIGLLIAVIWLFGSQWWESTGK